MALRQIPNLLQNRSFVLTDFIDNFDDYGAEIDLLESNGLLSNPQGEWIIAQGAFLWWLADELRRNLRDETDFKAWLHGQELDVVFTHGEQAKIQKCAATILSAVGNGAVALINAFAKGIGSGAVSPFMKTIGT